jgi:hypothetical protein
MSKEIDFHLLEKFACTFVNRPSWFTPYEKFVAYKDRYGQFLRIFAGILALSFAAVIDHKIGWQNSLWWLIGPVVLFIVVAFVGGILRQRVVKGWLKDIQYDYNVSQKASFTISEIQHFYRMYSDQFDCRKHGCVYKHPERDT